MKPFTKIDFGKREQHRYLILYLQPDCSHQFVVEVDASDVGVGTSLCQSTAFPAVQDIGKMLPLAILALE